MDDIQLEELDMDIPESVGEMVLMDSWESDEWEDDSMFKQIPDIDWE